MSYATGYVYVSDGANVTNLYLGSVGADSRETTQDVDSRSLARQSLTWTGGTITNLYPGYSSGDFGIYYGSGVNIPKDASAFASLEKTSSTNQYNHIMSYQAAINAGRINFIPLRDQAQDDNVVFLNGVSGSNKNNGADEDHAVADIDTAISILGPAGGTIVVTGNYSIGTLKNWPSSSGGVAGVYLGQANNVYTYEMPFEVTGGLIITGKYDSTDYGATVDLTSNGNTKFTIKGDTTFENISLADGSEAVINANGYELSVNAAVAVITEVYLSDGGTGDGTSAASPMGSFDAAFNALTLSEDCTIYIVGKYTQTGIIAPAKTGEGSVTVTSYNDGETYTDKAVFESPASRLSLSTDFVFDNIDLNFTGNYYLIMCQYHDFTITESVEITAPNVTNADILHSISINSGYHTNSQAGGMVANSDCKITVNSGEKYFIMPQGYQETVGTYTGTVTVNLGGDANVSRIYYTGSSVALTGGNTTYNISGDAQVTSIQRGQQDNINDGYMTLTLSDNAVLSSLTMDGDINEYLTITLNNSASITSLNIPSANIKGIKTFTDNANTSTEQIRKKLVVNGGFDAVTGYISTDFDVTGLGLSIARAGTGTNFVTDLLIDGVSYYNKTNDAASAFKITDNTAKILLPDNSEPYYAVQVISRDPEAVNPVYSNYVWLVTVTDGTPTAVRADLLSNSLGGKGFAIRTTAEDATRDQGLRFTGSITTDVVENDTGWKVTEYGLLAKQNATDAEMLYDKDFNYVSGMSNKIGQSATFIRPYGDTEPTTNYFRTPSDGETGKAYFAAAITELLSTEYDTAYDFKPYMVVSNGANSAAVYGIPYTSSAWAVANQCDEEDRVGLVTSVLGMENRKTQIIAVGDSITDESYANGRGWESYTSQLSGLLSDDYIVENYGKAGSRVINTTDKAYVRYVQYADSITSYPDIVLLMLGTNDNTTTSTEVFKADLIELIEKYQSLPTSPEVYVMTMPPRFASATDDTRKDNAALVQLQKDAADECDAIVIDINELPLSLSTDYGDGIHPNEKGLGIIAKAVYDELTME
jgi:lysophospholipase L1-like esterase